MTVELFSAYGKANGSVELFTNHNGETYVAGYWGRHNTFANVHAENVLIVWS